MPGHFVSVDYYNKNLKPYKKACGETPKSNIPTCKAKHKLVFRPIPDEKQKDECKCLPSEKD